MPSLTRAEAVQRAALLTVEQMDLDLDLHRGPEVFGSTTTIRFRCARPGAATFVDVAPRELHSVTLNGVALDPTALVDGRLALTGLAAENTLVAEATMAYSRDGQGLHRAADPADGEHYVYGHVFLDAAPKVFACFDQPDLKAPYAVSVTAPVGWTVLGNGAARETAPGRWELAGTRPLATYFVTVCAGPWASVLAEHDGIPLGLHARKSLREPLERQAAQLLRTTGECFDYYHQLFGIRYPFGEYHQVFVPEFNAGAMENPGCVTFRDQFVFRGAATGDEVLTRANTIAHEMAHMWFGDLVTMQWWDDLWLNESFAEYMAHRTLVAATEYDGAWVDSTMARKTWGYAAERTPSTHPIAGTAARDAQEALSNFDGISYAKGAAALRQLIAHLGDDAFIEGVSAYLRAHAFGNGTLADFLGSMEAASGKDLEAWSRAWLLTAGVDTIAVDASTGEVTRTPPAAHPAGRPHTLDVAGFSDGAEVFRVEAVVTERHQTLVALAEAPKAKLVVPNAADLTWATVELDGATLAQLPGQLAEVPDPQARAVLWVALTDGIYLGRVDPRLAIECFSAAWPLERNDSILTRAGNAVIGRIIPTFLSPQRQPAGEAAVADAAHAVLRSSEPSSSRALLAARTLARTSADTKGLLDGWACGDTVPQGLEGDSDFRWLVVRQLARHGGVDAAFIERTRQADDTLAGRLAALAARAALPDEEAKAWAWGELTTGERSNYELNALASGFWLAPDLALVRDYVPRYFRDIPRLAHRIGEDALSRIATLAYPSRVVEPATQEASTAALARTDLSPAVRRAIVDADSQLGEALRSRSVFD